MKFKNCEGCGKEKRRPYKYSQAQWDEFKYCSKRCLGDSKINPDKKPPRKRIAFVWQGISDPQVLNQWNDGLREAMRLLTFKYKVLFYEPFHEIENADLILYWEAPVTAQGQNGPYYNKVRQNPIKKALLFAGGPIKREWVSGFDLLFLESKINERECDELGIRWKHAFGINDKNFKFSKKENPKKYWDGMLAGTGASWKRQWLIGEALGNRALLMGRDQETDSMPFRVCREQGATVMGEQSSSFVARCLRESHTCVNPCDYWGGGQRATLEAMAMGVPVVVCNDSPKNIEFVEASGFGRIVDPSAQSIKEAVEDLKANPLDPLIGVNYVKSKWSAKIYAEQLISGIEEILHD